MILNWEQEDVDAATGCQHQDSRSKNAGRTERAKYKKQSTPKKVPAAIALLHEASFCALVMSTVYFWSEPLSQDLPVHFSHTWQYHAAMWAIRGVMPYWYSVEHVPRVDMPQVSRTWWLVWPGLALCLRLVCKYFAHSPLVHQHI